MEQRKTTLSFVLSRMLLLVLVAVMALSAVSCGGGAESETEAAVPKTFTFQVRDLEGTVIGNFRITTEREMVGEALLDEGLIEGEDGPYGLYVKTVNGITADYDVDGTYWAFYIGGIDRQYATTGVDATPVEDNGVYSFQISK